MLSVAALTDQLRGLGLEGRAVMVHASLRRLGPVEGRAEGVVAALDAAVGPAGGLLMVLGAEDAWNWVNERPEPVRERLLAEAPVFDPLETPAEPEVGVLAEVFRKTPGTIVTDHPEGRFGARGGLAEALLRDPPWDDYYGPGSPLQHLCDLGGAVLRLGADPETVTLMHYAEYLAPVTDKRRARRHRRVKGPEGPVVRVVDGLDDSEGIVDWAGEDYFGAMLGDYLASGRGLRARVGGAPTELLEAQELVAFSAAWMGERFQR